MTEKTRLIIAGSKREADAWLIAEQSLNPRRCRYVYSPKCLMGYSSENAEIVLVGRYWLNPVCDTDMLTSRFPDWLDTLRSHILQSP